MIQKKVDLTGTIQGLEQAIESTLEDNAVGSLLLFVADGNGFSAEVLNPILNKISVPVFGGIFPAIISGQSKFTQGSIVLGFKKEMNVQFIGGLSDPNTEFEEIIDTLIPDVGNAKTMFVLVDGYSHRVSDFIESLFNIFGLELNYIGGGAGSINTDKLDLEQTYCLLTNQGMKKDGALLALADIESSVGVQHGWDITVSGHHKVTESEGNTIKTLDWIPAFEVYKEVVEKQAKREITEDNFFEIAKSYPLGISKLESEMIVRDPFGVTEENGLFFNASIPQESFVDILTGDRESLIRAAGNASRNSLENLKSIENKTILLVDCISRVLFLEDQFKDELAAVQEEGIDIVGILSLGEIANCGSDYLEMYNKTCVVGVIASP